MSKFRILWIDDQPKKCRREVKQVKSVVDAFGFEPDIDLVSDISASSLKSPDGTLYKKLRARDIDLFLIDYNLKNDVLGSNVIQEIRKENDIYSDIVFYSSLNSDFIGTVKASFDSPNAMEYFDGVYIVPLGDEFVSKIQYVVNKIIKSWYNVHSIRGIVLSKASKFEHVVSEIINAHYEPCLEEIKTALHEKGENVCKSTSGKWAKVDKASDPVPKILKDPISFNWAVKDLILKIIIEKGLIALPSYDDIAAIFSLRNDFAHNPIHLKDGELVLTKKDSTRSFNEADIEAIRQQLMRIEKDLESFQVPATVPGKELVSV